MKGPTTRQLQLLAFIQQSVESRGIPPTQREMLIHLGLSPKATLNAAEHIHRMMVKGYLAQAPRKSRAIKLTPFGLSLIGRGTPETRFGPPRSTARIVRVNTGYRCGCGAHTFATDKPCPMCRRNAPTCAPSTGGGVTCRVAANA